MYKSAEILIFRRNLRGGIYNPMVVSHKVLDFMKYAKRRGYIKSVICVMNSKTIKDCYFLIFIIWIKNTNPIFSFRGMKG